MAKYKYIGGSHLYKITIDGTVRIFKYGDEINDAKDDEIKNNINFEKIKGGN